MHGKKGQKHFLLVCKIIGANSVIDGLSLCSKSTYTFTIDLVMRKGV